MAFVRSVARQMAHGVERTDVNLALRKWWKLGYTRQNGLVRAAVLVLCIWRGWLLATVLLRAGRRIGGVVRFYFKHSSTNRLMSQLTIHRHNTDHQDALALRAEDHLPHARGRPSQGACPQGY